VFVPTKAPGVSEETPPGCRRQIGCSLFLMGKTPRKPFSPRWILAGLDFFLFFGVYCRFFPADRTAQLGRWFLFLRGQGRLKPPSFPPVCCGLKRAAPFYGNRAPSPFFPPKIFLRWPHSAPWACTQVFFSPFRAVGRLGLVPWLD